MSHETSTMSIVQRQAPLCYYEGLWPGPRVMMLATSVSTFSGGGIHPKMYLRWKDVQFPFQVEKATGNWLLVDLVSELPGRTVTVYIDDKDDSATVVALMHSVLPSTVKQKTLFGKLGWALQIPPRKCSRKCPIRSCSSCGTEWTISDQDRDWHTLGSQCGICAVQLGPPHFD